MKTIRSLALILVMVSSTALAESPYSVVWVKQFGTDDADATRGVAFGGSGIHATGYLRHPASGYDAFLRKYDSSGGLIYDTFFAGASTDVGRAVTVDQFGSPYVGYYSGGLSNTLEPDIANDAFVRKFDGTGNEVKTSGLGSSFVDETFGVAVDTSGASFMSGFTGGNIDGNVSVNESTGSGGVAHGGAVAWP